MWGGDVAAERVWFLAQLVMLTAWVVVGVVAWRQSHPAARPSSLQSTWCWRGKQGCMSELIRTGPSFPLCGARECRLAHSSALQSVVESRPGYFFFPPLQRTTELLCTYIPSVVSVYFSCHQKNSCNAPPCPPPLPPSLFIFTVQLGVAHGECFDTGSPHSPSMMCYNSTTCRVFFKGGGV